MLGDELIHNFVIIWQLCCWLDSRERFPSKIKAKIMHIPTQSGIGTVSARLHVRYLYKRKRERYTSSKMGRQVHRDAGGPHKRHVRYGYQQSSVCQRLTV